MMEMNVTAVREFQGHAPPGNFENLRSQKCHFLHSESLSCFVYGIFIRTDRTVWIDKLSQRSLAFYSVSQGARNRRVASLLAARALISRSLTN